MTRPRLLDLFCGAGGAAMGYHRAGFDIVGVDIEPQPSYPFEFHQLDAMALRRDALRGCWHERGDLSGLPGQSMVCLGRFDAIHASPPCQAYSTITADKSKHPKMIDPTRDLLAATGLPYVIENVEGARSHLRHPVMICGSAFGLKVRRHRWFESNVLMLSTTCDHRRQGRPIGVYGDHPQNDTEYRRPDGTLRGDKARTDRHAREVMEMPWADWHGCTQAIPPTYTEYIGAQLLEHIGAAA